MGLIDKMEAARQHNITIDGVTLTIKRPREYEVVTVLERGNPREVLRHFVVGWSGIEERDLIPGGDPEPAPFETDVFLAWADDRLEIWPKIIEAVKSRYETFKADKDAALGKPGAG